MNEKKVNYAGLGLIMGSAIGFGLGMIIYMSTGEPLYLLIGTMGTAVGLIMGAGIDHSQKS